MALLSAAGVAALRLDAVAAKSPQGPEDASRLPRAVAVGGARGDDGEVGAAKLPITWLAQGVERAWATGSRL